MYLNGLSPPAGKDICIIWDLSAHCSYPAAVLLPTQTRKVASVSADGSRGCAKAVVQFLDNVLFGSS
jgi:hypothetical protein